VNGIAENEFAKMQILVKPNPFSQTAEVNFYVGKEGMVHVRLYDIFGRTVASLSQNMDCGTQQLLVNAGSSGHYFLSIETPTDKRVAKLLSMGNGGGEAAITPIRHCEGYRPKQSSNRLLHSVRNDAPFNSPEGGKHSPPLEGLGEASQKSDPDLPFDIGDTLQFTAYTTNNGHVYTYLPQTEQIQTDKDLLFIYNPVPATDYTLESGCEWDFTKVQEDSLYISNSEEELLAFITCDADSTPPAIDFTKYSLLLVHGNTIYGSIANITKTLMQLSANDYKLNVEISLSDTVGSEPWAVAMVVPKVSEVPLNIYYPHIEVWKYTLPFNWTSKVTITLTLDTLRKSFYTISSPEDLEVFFPSATFYMNGGWEGNYYVYIDSLLIPISDVMHFYDGAEFKQTMYSLDSMLLQWTGPRPDFGTQIWEFLFIKQSNF
jgi:hypothetical protein